MSWVVDLAFEIFIDVFGEIFMALGNKSVRDSGLSGKRRKALDISVKIFLGAVMLALFAGLAIVLTEPDGKLVYLGTWLALGAVGILALLTVIGLVIRAVKKR